MKRVIAFILCVVLLLGLIPAAIFVAQAAELDTSGTLLAGYNKVRIDPSEHPDYITGLPMSGYGASTDRLSEGGMDDTGDGKVTSADGLFSTCIALTDQYGRSILYYGIDIINGVASWTDPAKKVILSAVTEAGYEMEVDDIYISASHTHNGPDLTYAINFTEAQLASNSTARRTKTYRDWVFEQLAKSAVAAMKDREEVTMTKGTIDVSDTIKALNPKATVNQQRMNYVRHYKSVKNGDLVYGGSNFGYTNTSSSDMVMDPVDLMHLIQFTPKSGTKDPIVIVNWDAHVTINSTTSTAYGRTNHKKISSDWVNNLRYGLEGEGYRPAFSQGTAGNKTPTTTVTSLKNPDVLVGTEGRGYKYGRRLAEIAAYGLKNNMGKALDTSYIRSATARFDFKTNAPTPEEAELVKAMLAADPSTYPSGYTDLIDYLSHADTWPNRTKYYATYPYLKNINSRYQLSNIKSRMAYLDTTDSYITVGVLAIGKELSFLVSPNELADRYSSTDTLSKITDNDWDDLIDDTYGRPVVMGYTNGAAGYIPHQLAYTYNEGSTEYAVGSYESQVARYGRYTGEQLVVFYKDLLKQIHPTETRMQCVCGGKAVDGENGHTCKPVEYLPWTKTDSLPNGGNYYLTGDVVTNKQTEVTSTLRLDLNGHSITHKVTAEQGELAVAGKTHNTRVISLSSTAHLYLTDSTDKPGKITRDLSNLTDAQKDKITNYGLLLFISGDAKVTMFDGVLDATDMVAGGGGCVCLYTTNASFVLHGGTLLGGKSGSGGVIYNRGNVELYGGLLTGGTTKSSSSYCPGVYVVTKNGIPGKVTIGGDVRIENNKRSNGRDVNIYFSINADSEGADPAENFVVKENFTGKASIYIGSRSAGKVIGICENPNITANNLTLDYFTDYGIGVAGGKLVLVGEKEMCACGGTLTGKTVGDHTCQNITWNPWPSTTSLPTTEGNYYLMGDVTTQKQLAVSKNLRIDLNGFDITHKVTDTKNSRVFALTTNGSLAITDSTAKPGALKRDLSALSESQKNAITNYGLLVLVVDDAGTGDFTLYNGVLDGQGAKTNGGVIANLNTQGAAVNIYGGTVTGANCRTFNNDGGNGGGICSLGAVAVYGGTITGNTAVNGGAVYLSGAKASLLLTGNPDISGNTGNGGKTVSNIYAPNSTVTVKDTFTGTAGFTVTNPANGKKVADSSNANISAAKLTVDGNPAYTVVMSGNQLVMQQAYTAAVRNGAQEQGYETLTKAIAAYPGGDAVITLLADNAETVAFPANANLDLNGFDLTGTVTQKGTLFVKDSATDDYTTEDAQGYGLLPKTLTDVQPVPGYLMATQTKGYSFHCLNLDTVSVNLRPSDAGLYFQSQFGGDEYIKSIVKTYGVALGAGSRPNFAEGTFSAYDGSTWTVGADSKGNAKNLKQGTLLEDIMTTSNSADQNQQNASMKIYAKAYIELADGTRYVGGMVCLDLKTVFEGNESVTGADGLWNALTADQQKSLTDMYKTYESVMSAWNIPNIKAAIEEA